MLQSRPNVYYSIVDKPNRVTATFSTLLERILTNNATSQITPGILKSDICDHFPTFVLIKNGEKSLLLKIDTTEFQP